MLYKSLFLARARGLEVLSSCRFFVFVFLAEIRARMPASAAVLLAGPGAAPGIAVDQFLRASSLSIASTEFACVSGGLSGVGSGSRYEVVLVALPESGAAGGTVRKDALGAASRCLRPGGTVFVYEVGQRGHMCRTGTPQRSSMSGVGTCDKVAHAPVHAGSGLTGSSAEGAAADWLCRCQPCFKPARHHGEQWRNPPHVGSQQF